MGLYCNPFVICLEQLTPVPTSVVFSFAKYWCNEMTVQLNKEILPSAIP